MIDGIRPRRVAGPGLRPADRHLRERIIVGDHTTPPPTAAGTPADNAFAPPEDVAASEEATPETSTAGNIAQPPEEPRPSFWSKLQNLDKKQWAIIISVTIVLIGGGVAAFLVFHKSKPTVQQHPTVSTTKKAEPVKPTTVASKMSGLQVDPSVNERPVTAIMIENSGDARPQSALNKADVVFEAIAEGGITRFLTLWQDNEPDYIGPVRSVRPYYIQWAMGFDAAIAHVGGSGEALQDMRSWGAKDLDQFAGGAYFWRISSRYAPHNMYTSMAKLREYEAKKGYGKANYTGFSRKTTEQPAKTPTAKSIDFTVSGAFYNPHYDYDASTNSYKRSEGGAPHMVVDQAGNQTQLSPKVVIALVFPQGNNGIYTTYQTVGSGHMYVFQDGTVTEGTWRKDGNSSQFVFTDSTGAPLKLNPGQTWISAVGDTSRVKYAP